MTVENTGYTDGNQAANDLTNALSTSNIDGATYVSSSVVPNGYSGSSGSSTNLGLILGLAIPLGLILILIVVLGVYYKSRKNKPL